MDPKLRHRVNSEITKRLDLPTYELLFKARFPEHDFEPFREEFLSCCGKDSKITRKQLKILDRARDIYKLERHSDREYNTCSWCDCTDTRCCGNECWVLPCYDEADDGIPPCCRGNAPVAWWKVFNHNNRLTNDNIFCIAFGNIGFPYFDRRRKLFMGIAMWSTFVSIFFTIWGTAALSDNSAVVSKTFWTYVGCKNHTSGDVFAVQVALTSMVYVFDCSVGIGNTINCEKEVLHYHENTGYPNLFLRDGIRECRDTTFVSSFNVFTTCVTLGFALIGCMNRMKYRSDANIQKALGMITDFCGVLGLSSQLSKLLEVCYFDVMDNDRFNAEMEVEVQMGPGYWCLVVCFFAATLRCLVHWLTPLPVHGYSGEGSGCFPRIPENLLMVMHHHHNETEFNIDGDEGDNLGNQESPENDNTNLKRKQFSMEMTRSKSSSLHQEVYSELPRQEWQRKLWSFSDRKISQQYQKKQSSSRGDEAPRQHQDEIGNTANELADHDTAGPSSFL